MDEPRRPRRRAAAGLRRHRVERERADRRDAASRRSRFTACSSIPKSRTRRAAASSSRTSSSASATPSRVGRRARSSRARSRRFEQLVGDARVICGLSGGVDSSVAAALVHRAIGDQLTCVFVDTGLLRLHEREQVERTFSANLGIKLVTVDASRALPRRARRRRGSGEEAQDHRPHVHRRLRGSDERRGRRTRDVPRAGHALSRRDRVVLAARRPVGDDQDAPQRRRPQARHEVQAHRAAARAVQGRSAQRRPRARACPRRWSAAIRSPDPGLAFACSAP